MKGSHAVAKGRIPSRSVIGAKAYTRRQKPLSLISRLTENCDCRLERHFRLDAFLANMEATQTVNVLQVKRRFQKIFDPVDREFFAYWARAGFVAGKPSFDLHSHSRISLPPIPKSRSNASRSVSGYHTHTSARNEQGAYVALDGVGA